MFFKKTNSSLYLTPIRYGMDLDPLNHPNLNDKYGYETMGKG
jgi:hypothetical protein